MVVSDCNALLPVNAPHRSEHFVPRSELLREGGDSRDSLAHIKRIYRGDLCPISFISLGRISNRLTCNRASADYKHAAPAFAVPNENSNDIIRVLQAAGIRSITRYVPCATLRSCAPGYHALSTWAVQMRCRLSGDQSSVIIVNATHSVTSLLLYELDKVGCGVAYGRVVLLPLAVVKPLPKVPPFSLLPPSFLRFLLVPIPVQAVSCHFLKQLPKAAPFPWVLSSALSLPSPSGPASFSAHSLVVPFMRRISSAVPLSTASSPPLPHIATSHRYLSAPLSPWCLTASTTPHYALSTPSHLFASPKSTKQGPERSLPCALQKRKVAAGGQDAKRKIAARLAIEEIYNDVEEGSELTADYVYFILVASMIAALGLG